MDDFRQRVLDDLGERVAAAIKTRSDYAIGEIHGRLIAFALSEVITKEDYDHFHDRLEAAGIESIRLS